MKSKVNIKKEQFIHDRYGFIFANMLIMLPIICTLLITILLITSTISKNMLIYIDNWMLQQQTRTVLENMATEIIYADEIIKQVDFAGKETLIIATKRRASANSSEMEKYLGFRKEGPKIYRCEMSKIPNDYTIKSKQPLNSENYFGDNNLTYVCEQIDENIYSLEIKGSSYRTKQNFNLQTIVIKRNHKENE